MSPEHSERALGQAARHRVEKRYSMNALRSALHQALNHVVPDGSPAR